MTDRTRIEWTDASWNPIRGCSRVSAGCQNCYAEREAWRFAKPGQPYHGLVQATSQGPKWTGAIRTVDSMLDQPLRWRRPRRIFVNSMSDLFHDAVPREFVQRVFEVMAQAPHHQFQILTKRPQNARALLNDSKFSNAVMSRAIAAATTEKARELAEQTPWPLPNVWLGVSVEDQETAQERVPVLLTTPAAVRWVSAEPLLGPVSLSVVHFSGRDALMYWQAGLLYLSPIVVGMALNGHPVHLYDFGRLDWVVVGGESGPGARPLRAEYVRWLQAECEGAGTPFFFKQWGEWVPIDQVPVESRGICAPVRREPGRGHLDDVTFLRLGKRTTGRELDGRIYSAMPR